MLSICEQVSLLMKLNLNLTDFNSSQLLYMPNQLRVFYDIELTGWFKEVREEGGKK